MDAYLLPVLTCGVFVAVVVMCPSREELEDSAPLSCLSQTATGDTAAEADDAGADGDTVSPVGHRTNGPRMHDDDDADEDDAHEATIRKLK